MYDLILISPKNTQLGRFKRFVPVSVPIGVGILAGFLRKHGFLAYFVGGVCPRSVAATQTQGFRCGNQRLPGGSQVRVQPFPVDHEGRFNIARAALGLASEIFLGKGSGAGVTGQLRFEIGPKSRVVIHRGDYLLSG